MPPLPDPRATITVPVSAVPPTTVWPTASAPEATALTVMVTPEIAAVKAAPLVVLSLFSAA